MIGISLGIRLGGRGRANPAIITAETAPSLAAADDADTPADVFTAGSYSSSAGTIASTVPTYYVNGSSVASDYDLTAGDTLRVTELVTDSEGNPRTFATGPVIVTPSVALANSELPEISVNNFPDQSLTVSTGTWAGSAPRSFTFQWTRNEVSIPGAIGGNYLTTTADEGAQIGCDVTATDGFTTITVSANPVTISFIAPLTATGAAPGLITLQQGAGSVSVDASGWVEGGTAPYSFEADGVDGRVSASGTGLNDVDLSFNVYGPPVTGASVSFTVTDAAGDELVLSTAVTIEPTITISGENDTLTYETYADNTPFALGYLGESYPSETRLAQEGPVNVALPDAVGTPIAGSTLTAIEGKWHALSELGSVAIGREWRSGDGTLLGFEATYDVTSADETAGLYLYETAIQGGFPTREAFTEIIAAVGGQTMVLLMTVDGIGSGGTPRALTSQPLTMTTDGF